MGGAASRLPSVLCDCLLFQVLDEELRLNKCSSFELIEQYYLEKISHQVSLSSDRTAAGSASG